MTTFLYVDDEESIGRVVARFFSRRGDQVLLAKSIAEAQAILATEDPAVVFIDLWLGAESGFALMNWIEDVHPHLCHRVTFVTGENAEWGGDRPWTRLDRPVIQKPFELARLAVVIDEAGSRAGS